MKRNERGMSLMETLLVVVITAILMGAITQSMLIGLRTMDDTNQLVIGSNDTQLIAAYFTSDVASAENVSVTGETNHAAPGQTSVNPNSQLLSFWALQTGTSIQPPSDMAEAWDKASTGSDPTQRITAAMAEVTLSLPGPSGDRVGTSLVGTSSTTHSVVLDPSGSSAPERKETAVAVSTAGTKELNLTAPLTSPQAGDLLIAQIATGAGGATTVTAPAGWRQEATKSASSGASSTVYSHPWVSGETANWKWTFSRNVDSSGDIARYRGAAGVLPNAPSEVNPCGGDTPVLLLSWLERKPQLAAPEFNEVTYNYVIAGNEYTLVRRHCHNSTGIPSDSQTLARNLGDASVSPATAGCQPSDCQPAAATVSVRLTLTEGKPPSGVGTARTYQVTATTRKTRAS